MLQAALCKCNLKDRNLIIKIIELILIERIVGIERKGIGISMPKIFIDNGRKHQKYCSGDAKRIRLA